MRRWLVLAWTIYGAGSADIDDDARLASQLAAALLELPLAGGGGAAPAPAPAPEREWRCGSDGEGRATVAFEAYPERKWDTAALTAQKASVLDDSAAARAAYERTGGFREAVPFALRRLDGAQIDGNALCGSSPKEAAAALRRGGGVALVTRGHRKPSTLRHSMASWAESGLLSLVDERLIVLSEPLPAEVAVATRYGFDIRTPAGLLGPAAAKVLSTGATFAAALNATTAKYVLFLERHHAVAAGASREALADELVAAALLLNRGAAFVRLRSAVDQRCKCDAKVAPKFDSEASLAVRGTNWWSFYCDVGDEAPPENVGTCVKLHGAAGLPPRENDPLEFKCFSSADSDWSLDAVVVDRANIQNARYTYPTEQWYGRFKTPTTLAEFAAQDPQRGISDKWDQLHVPICLSTRGLFARVEVRDFDR